MTLIEAIAREEGFYVTGSRAQRNRNPGNLEFGQFTADHGATGSDGRFAIFPNPNIGFAAMLDLLREKYAGLTISQALTKYAPPVENDTSSYISNVCHWANLKPTDSIDICLVAATASLQ